LQSAQERPGGSADAGFTHEPAICSSHPTGSVRPYCYRNGPGCSRTSWPSPGRDRRRDSVAGADGPAPAYDVGGVPVGMVRSGKNLALCTRTTATMHAAMRTRTRRTRRTASHTFHMTILRMANRSLGRINAGRSRQWLGAVPAAGVWAACPSLPCVTSLPACGRRTKRTADSAVVRSVTGPRRGPTAHPGEPERRRQNGAGPGRGGPVV